MKHHAPWIIYALTVSLVLFAPFIEAQGPTASRGVRFPDGTISSPAIAFASRPQLGFYKVDNNNIGLPDQGLRFINSGDTTQYVRLDYANWDIYETLSASFDISFRDKSTTRVYGILSGVGLTLGPFGSVISAGNSAGFFRIGNNLAAIQNSSGQEVDLQLRKNLMLAVVAPSTPSAGYGSAYVDSTGKVFSLKDDAGAVTHTVQTKDCSASTQLLQKINADGTVTCASATAAGGGTVNSVGMTGDNVIFDTAVAGSPVTGSGTLVPSLKTQTANTVLAGPTSAGPTAPTFRALGASDLPAFARTAFMASSECNNASAVAVYDLPTSNAPTPTCYGTSYRFGALDYDDAANESSTFFFPLPTGWTGNIDFTGYGFVNATSQSLKLTVATVCIATSSDILNPTFNAAQTITVTSPGTANQLFTFAQSAVTITGCSAGNTLVLKIGRDTTDTSTSTLSFTGTQLVIRVTPQS